MQISHLGHACVLVQTDDAKVLIDPGNLSEGAWSELTDLDAVLVTHFHADHLDPEQLPALLRANAGAQVWVEPSIITMIGDESLPTLEGAKAFASGDRTQVGALTVRAVGGQHAVIHRDMPRAGNVGLLLGAEGEPTLFHPGDSYDTTPEGVDVLAMPAYGPWAALKETIDFVRAVGAAQAFPIHEGLLNERGYGLVTGRAEAMSETEILDLRGGVARGF